MLIDVRTVSLVAVLATTASWLLGTTAPALPTTSPTITALTLPSTVYVDERIAVRGSIMTAEVRELDHRLHVCTHDAPRCATTGWGTISGGGHWRGYAGLVRLDEPGTYRVVWTVYAPWDADAKRAATRAEWEVIVVAAPD